MQKFSKQGSGELSEVCCNRCGRKLEVKEGIVREGCVSARIPFGYFSGKDRQIHRFDLCEACYDEMVSAFRIPVEIEENTELL